MSQNKSLATLFQELGNDPETLALFQANPNKFLSDLSPEDQEKLKSISTQLNIKASKNSPEFRATSNPLRDNDPIIPGDFYMGADDGGTIYQLYTTRDMPTFSGNSSYFSALIDPQGVANRLPVHEDKSDDFHEFLKFDPSQDESEISNCFLAVKHFESPSNTYHIAEVKTLLLSVHKNAINPSKPYVIKASFDPSNHPQPGNVVFWVYVSKPGKFIFSGDINLNNDKPIDINGDAQTPDKKGYKFGFITRIPKDIVNGILTITADDGGNKYICPFVNETGI